MATKLEALYIFNEWITKAYTTDSLVAKKNDFEAIFGDAMGIGFSPLPDTPQEVTKEDFEAMANLWLLKAIGKIYTPISIAGQRQNIESMMQVLEEKGGSAVTLTPEIATNLFQFLGLIALHGTEAVKNMMDQAVALGLLETDQNP